MLVLHDDNSVHLSQGLGSGCSCYCCLVSLRDEQEVCSFRENHSPSPGVARSGLRVFGSCLGLPKYIFKYGF